MFNAALLAKASSNSRGDFLQPIDEKDDHVYVDVDIKYNSANDPTGFGRLATYSAVKTEPILTNPSKYHLIVDRFQISASSLPVYIFDPNAPPTITLSYNGVDATQAFVFDYRGVPTTPTLAPDGIYYFVYTIQHFLDMFNVAAAAAFATLAPAIVGSTAPWAVWDGDRVAIYAQKANYDIDLALPIEVFVNDECAQVFPFIDYVNIAPNDNQIIIADIRNNTEAIGGINHLFMRQQADGAYAFNPIRSLLFTSNTIPVKSSYTNVSNQGAIVGGSAYVNNNADTNSLGVLIDFKLDTPTPMAQRTILTYTPQQNYRRLDMYGTAPLRSLDVSVFYVDVRGRLYPLRIRRNEEVNIKLLFARK